MTDHSFPKQAAEILAYLRAGNSLTPLDALHLFGCNRLAARIFEIRQSGVAIQDKWVKQGEKRWKRYFIAEQVAA